MIAPLPNRDDQRPQFPSLRCRELAQPGAFPKHDTVLDLAPVAEDRATVDNNASSQHEPVSQPNVIAEHQARCEV